MKPATTNDNLFEFSNFRINMTIW